MAFNRIEVPVEIIERACRRDSRHCMVAEAIQAAKPEWKNISVDLAIIRWTNPRTHQRYTALTPDAIRNAIFAFDQGEPVEPFAFTLMPIHKVKSTAGMKKGAAETSRASRERQRQRANPKIVTASGGRQVIEGGPDLPRGHMAGTPSSGQNRQGELEASPAGNIRLSGGRYRQYGLRQLKP
jgi:hypothetical protein